MADNEVIEGEIVASTVEQGQPVPHNFKLMKKRRGLNDVTPDNLEDFLKNLETTGLVYQSAERAGLGYLVINRLQKEDEDFKLWVQEALDHYRESVIAEVHRRAMDGWDEPVYSQRTGQQMGVVRKYDSRLLEMLVKRHDPAFREKFEGEIKVSGGVLVAPLMAPSAEDWEKKFGGNEQIRLLSTETGGKTAESNADVA